MNRRFDTRESPAMTAARRALRARRGPPGEADAPRPSTFPGKKVDPIPGQLDLAGNEALVDWDGDVCTVCGDRLGAITGMCARCHRAELEAAR
jgi:hypothetical protein